MSCKAPLSIFRWGNCCNISSWHLAIFKRCRQLERICIVLHRIFNCHSWAAPLPLGEHQADVISSERKFIKKICTILLLYAIHTIPYIYMNLVKLISCSFNTRKTSSWFHLIWETLYKKISCRTGLLWTNSEHTLKLLWTYSEHTLNILWTYPEHTLNILWTYSEHTLKICPRFDQISKTSPTHSLSNIDPRDASASKNWYNLGLSPKPVTPPIGTLRIPNVTFRP